LIEGLVFEAVLLNSSFQRISSKWFYFVITWPL